MQDLNHEQTLAVERETFGSRPLAIVAGPGSGKTRVLVARAIREALTHGADKVAVCTFTRSAAQELTRRLDAQGVKLGYVGTIHGLAFSMLKRMTAYARFNIVDSNTARVTMQQIAAIQGTERVFNQALELVPKVMDLHLGNTAPDYSTTDFAIALAKRYVSEMFRAHKVDYAMLLAIVRRQLQHTHGEELAHVNPFKCVLVDEYQDVSVSEHRFIEAMRCDLIAVGDVNQAVFQFKGGDSNCFRELMTHGTLCCLHLNHRSRQEICALANRVIGAAAGIRAVSTEPGEVFIEETENRQKDYEAKLLAQFPPECQAWKSGESIAVLCRYNEEVDFITSFLQRNGIAVHRKQRVHKNEVTLTAFAFLTDPDNDFLCKAFAAAMWGPQFAAMQYAQAQSKGVTLNEHLKIEDSPRTMGEAIARLMEVSSDGRFSKWRRETVEALAEIVFRDDMAGATPQDVLEEYNAGGRFEPSHTAVNVLTMHAAKGLEFDAVIVANAADSVIPGSKEGESLEAERNLLYVAVTRAAKRLVVMSRGPASRFINGKEAQ